MNRLNNHMAYLIGPIDRCPNYGKNWREDISEFLWSLNIGVFNPCNKPIINQHVHEDKDFVARINSFKKEKKFDEVSRIMKEIVRQDLKMVDLCNFAIMHVDPTIHMCGSYTEFTYACLERTPVIIHCEKKENIPNWMFGLADHRLVFENWDEVKTYITDINSGIIQDDLDSKWRFIDYDKVFNKSN